jgi:hypothetical protein
MLLLVILCRLLILDHKLDYILTYSTPQRTMALSDSNLRSIKTAYIEAPKISDRGDSLTVRLTKNAVATFDFSFQRLDNTQPMLHDHFRG